MRTECTKSESTKMRKPYLTPQPGEIWEIRRRVQLPEEFSPNKEKILYSTEAESFLKGDAPPRYVMIVAEPETEGDIISVMVFSAKTNFISNVDLLIPANISGLGQDLLAETWHVQPMLNCNLSQLVGNRLSRDIYDILLTIGDYYHGLINQPPEISNIEQLGLTRGDKQALKRPELTLFHQQEQAWSDVLTIPVAAYRTWVKSVNFTSQVLHQQLQIEQDLAECEPINNRFTDLLSNSFNKTQVILSRWWQNIFEPEWQAFLIVTNLAIATRSNSDSQNIPTQLDEIAAIIQQLSSTNDENQRQRAAKKLGEIAVGNSNAIQALENLLRSTADDETLWMAVESLQKIDSENPAVGIRRVRMIDLGMEIAGKTVALAVALLQKNDGDVGVLLQVYPTGNDDYLPPDLKLILLDNSGDRLREVIARQTDVYVQLKFSCEIGEQFSVQLALGDAHFREDFVI